MMTSTILILCVIATIFTTTQAFNKLLPSNEDVIYSWSANIRAGTYTPAPYASQFVLKGNILLQRRNESVFVKMTNLTHRLYNGIISQDQESNPHYSPIPEETKDLENIFRIVYDKNGIVDGIGTLNSEKGFSRNIKKAIATVFQMNSTLLEKEYQHAESVVVKENSIYGHGTDVYSFFPKSGNEIELHKLHNMPDSASVSQFSITNTEAAYCDYKNGKTVMHDSQKKYLITKSSKPFRVKEVTTKGSTVYYPFNARSDAQLIVVDQVFRFEEKVPRQEEYHIHDEYYETSLTYVPFQENPEELILDESNGRRVTNHTKILLLAKELLEAVPQYLQQDQINTQEPESKHFQLINRIQRLLLYLDVKNLQELKKTLSEDVLEVYVKILPMVTSEASTLYIKELVVGKVVTEDTAIDLLQRIAENIRPSLKLLSKLEDLIHLDLTFSWSVRKAAILAFGNIIFKSFEHYRQTQNNSEDIQKPYEKYVEEYITKLRTSPTYIVQVTYLLGLRNMKLPMLADKLIPTFDGTWWQNQHLRYMAIWASALPILFYSTPDKIIETYWPIFTNREELVELRVLSYYYIMYSRPTLSMLRNIYTYMLTEPNEEFYRLHYTLLQTVMQSTDPCHADMRVKLAQVIKFSPPPRGGSSFIDFFGYEDIQYGFSAGVQTYYFNTKNFRLYAIYMTMQQFNKYEEVYVVYWKIYDGKDTDPGLLQALSDILSPTNIQNKFDFHIEASIAKRGQIINTFAFDKSNLGELAELVKNFGKDAQTLTRNLLQMNYYKYNTALMPTDLGVPAFYEYLMPDIHYDNLTISKLITGNKIQIKVENMYSNWIHYRHGLSFYNPVSDVWQGINKFHTFDANLPFHVDISLTRKPISVKVNWNKHQNPLMNTIGLRSHGKQMVFVRDRDDYTKNPLEEFVPKGKHFEVITRGRYNTDDYSLVEADNSETGYRLYVGYYDSEMHIPYGTFKHRVLKLADPSSKYFHSLWQYLASAWHSTYHAIVLQPESDSHGFVIRMEPSVKYNITNANLILGLNEEFFTGDQSTLHLTYSLKNEEKHLKAWDLSIEVDLSRGHKSGELNVHIGRKVPGEKDYKICLSATKHWRKKETRGQVSIKLGESNDGCPNDTVVDVTMVGQRSSEQKKGHHKHASCETVMPYGVEYQKSMDCILSYTTLRHYSYNITTSNLPKSLTLPLGTWWNFLKGYLHSYYSYDLNSNNIKENCVRLNVTYPLKAKEVEIDIETKDEILKFSGLPLKRWEWLGPDSTTHPRSFLNQFKKDETDRCVVRHHHRRFNKHLVKEDVPTEWTLYVEDALSVLKNVPLKVKRSLNFGDFSVRTLEVDVPIVKNISIKPIVEDVLVTPIPLDIKNIENFSQDGIYLKSVNDKIAMKIKYEEHVFEVVPSGDAYQISVDGAVVPSGEEREEQWIQYYVIPEDTEKPLILFLQDRGIHVEYYVRYAVIVVPAGKHLQGRCFNKFSLLKTVLT